MNKDGIANFFLGLGIGVGIGMLFAPKSGDETRGMLMDRADDGKEFLKKQTSKLGDSANDLLGKGRDLLGKQKDNLNDALEAGKQAYREKVEPTVQSNLS